MTDGIGRTKAREAEDFQKLRIVNNDKYCSEVREDMNKKFCSLGFSTKVLRVNLAGVDP